MEIVLSELEKQAAKLKVHFHVSFSTDDKNTPFRIIKGRYEQNSDTAVLISADDIDDILELNHITGDTGRIKDILNSPDKLDVDKKIDDAVYSTLAKYFTQMLNAASGFILFAEIRPLPKHKQAYFKSRT